MDLSNTLAIISSAGYASAAQTDVEGTGVDTQGYEGVLFIAKYGTAADDNLIHAETGADNSVDWEDLEGSEVDVGTSKSNEIQWLDINHNVGDRYIRCVAERGTSSTLEFIIALPYGAHDEPVDNDTPGTIVGLLLTSPAEGTK